ncbi:PhzF family phenazine biosynthesis protein [Neisseria leonii]|uniref:PhzF family phenazine biosynthesis protein n=1 Tax=Neisseria leonii TaxID=2995413 RepID=UPI0030D3E44B
MAQYPIYIVDAFSDVPFRGNPAAVVLLDAWLPEGVMQQIAAENNLAETAFVVQKGDARFDIRWFSPLLEVDFCGHATLAASWVLFQRHTAWQSLSVYAPAVGEMRIEQAGGRIEMRFPNRAPEPLDTVPDALLQGLSIRPEKVLRNPQAYFAVYGSESDVRALQTDDAYLKQLAPYDVVATAEAEGGGYDFVSRYFWPANGGSEDAVTGSIHAGLAPYWAAELGRRTLYAFQASARGGRLYCSVDEDGVTVGGYCVPYLEGRISVAD